MITACGCIILPEVIAVLDPKQAECLKHGWQTIIGKATVQKVLTEVYDIPLTPVDSSGPPPF